jgi:UDP-glucuronate 4-epimerase
LIDWIEKSCGAHAEIDYLPKAAGDVPATWADISESRQGLGYEPKVSLEEGVGRFVDWYRRYAGV